MDKKNIKKRFRIPDRDVNLDGVEVEVTHTRTFQRLFYLKQLGLAHLIYPAAAHTRAAHSIECLYHAQLILDALTRNGSDITEKNKYAIRMAALLHDIAHVPFSHTLEDEHLILPKHDREHRLSLALGKLKEEIPDSPEALERIDDAEVILRCLAGGESRQPEWRSDLVGNTICADLLAYITTDARWTGIEKRPGYYRIYEYFSIEDNRLCISLTRNGVLRTDTVSAILDLLDMRYALTERVLFHHAKCVASAMLARATQLAGVTQNHESELLTLGDEGYFFFLERQANDLTSVDKDGVLRLVERLRSRRLYKRIFKINSETEDAWSKGHSPGAFSRTWRDPETVETLLCGVEDTLSLPRGTLALWCSDQSSGMKLVNANVVWGTAEGTAGPYPLRAEEVKRQFPRVYQRVTTIEEQYRDLWCFWIALDQEHMARAPEVVQQIEEGIQGIRCDEVFREMYLRKKLPGYREAETRLKGISREMNRLTHEVAHLLDEQVALDGDDANPDPQSILSAVATVASRKTQPTQQELPLKASPKSGE